jgi:hypothetical protein
MRRADETLREGSKDFLKRFLAVYYDHRPYMNFTHYNNALTPTSTNATKGFLYLLTGSRLCTSR